MTVSPQAPPGVRLSGRSTQRLDRSGQLIPHQLPAGELAIEPGKGSTGADIE
jgi:hypothetical protein